MLKKRLKLIIITSAITLVPMLLGLGLWQRLPETLPTHWNFEGVIDGYSSKGFVVFGMPAIMLGVHLLCIFFTSLDKRSIKYINSKIFTVVLFICPALSLFCTLASYAVPLNIKFDMNRLLSVVLGIMFLVIGNYLPKVSRNSTMGVKIPWTLRSDENWNKTHRFAGFVWTFGAIVMIIGGFFEKIMIYTTLVSVVAMAVLPIIYSYVYYKKYEKN